MEFECLNCEEDFEYDEFLPDIVKCPFCGTIMETDYDSDWDNYYCWAAKILA